MQGQINLDSKLGKYIYDLVSRKDINNIVEIGTWNGYGSTECIRKSIVDNNKENYTVYSLETNEKMYYQAIQREFPKNFNIILGRIIDEDDLNWMNWDEYFNSPEGYYHAGSKREWLNEDLYNLRLVENKIDLIPKRIDLLILDGGEFTTYPEYLKIGHRARFIILDDTNQLKCQKIREELINREGYTILLDELNDRCGYLIVENETFKNTTYL
jgi:hypothetical protein